MTEINEAADHDDEAPGVLFCETVGAGTPLLLLHGNGESARIWGAQYERWRDTHRIIAPDTRGHGRSSRGHGPLTMRRLAGDVAHILDDVAPGEAVDVVGFSDGGNIALTAAILYPELFRSIVTVGANSRPTGMIRKAYTGTVKDYLRTRARGLHDPEARAKSEIIGLMVHEPHLRPRDLARITVPTLVMAGEKDIIKRADTERIAAAIPGARYEIIPGAEHSAIVDQPEPINDAIERFWRELDD